MGDMLDYQGDDELARDLFKNALAGKWPEVVELYKKHGISAISATINTAGDTAFHIAVSIAEEDIVEELVHLIADIWESGLWIKNNDGNTPLHVAASNGKLRICILIAFSAQFTGDARNKAGESPLFLAAFYGHKDIFLCLHKLLVDTKTTSINPFYRRNDGETILHSAIRWEYFGIHVEELKKDTVRQELIPENYQTCIMFFQLPWIMAKRVIKSKKDNCKGRNADVESHGEQHVTDQTSKQKGSQSRSEARGIQFIRRPLAKIWFTILYISYTILKRIFLHLGFGS